ncbi:ABC transporter ATP-binding protein [Kiloniella sp. b19]|uniref:ABC transporter ATP-binding protein n=1 Tax=Kiloniella sp. GXU_MW_B19 TaxID=3141326 RepID=UPI0031DCAAE2
MKPKQNYSFLKEHGRLSGRLVALLLCLSVAGVFFEALGLGLILPVLDFIAAEGDLEQLSSDNSFWSNAIRFFEFLSLPVDLLTLTSLVLIAVLLRQIFDYWYLIKLSKTETALQKDLRIKSYQFIQSSRLGFIEQLGSGRFINLLDHQTEAAALVLTGYIRFARYIVTFAIYIALIVVTAPLSSGLAILMLGGLLLVVQVYVRKTREVSNQIVSYRTIFAAFLTEAYQAFRTVKIFSLQQQQTEQLRGISENFATLKVDLVKNGAKIPLVMAPTIAAVMMAFLYVSVTFLDMTINTITLFALILLRLAPAAQAFAKQQQGLTKHIVSLETLKKELENCDTNRDNTAQAGTPIALTKAIDVKSVCYAYGEGQRQVLKNISATFEMGRVIAITGSSGAGKSTLVDILSGLITPQSGDLVFDGQNIPAERQETIRQIVSYSAQEPFLFKGSVRDNICISNREADDQAITEAARMAYADHFIRELPGQYETLLEEGGGNLSGGQKQRLALARCFLKKSPLLILDEPTSALDPLSEQKVTQAIRQYAHSNGALVLIITHRDTTIQGVDETVIMENGEILEHQRHNTRQSAEYQ